MHLAFELYYMNHTGIGPIFLLHDGLLCFMFFDYADNLHIQKEV